MEENSCLIIFESAMNTRYINMAKLHDIDVFCANLENNLHNNYILNFLERLKSKKKLDDKICEFFKFLKKNEFCEIYFSSAEGFVSCNFIYRLKKEFPNVRLIALQHGIFSLRCNPVKDFLQNKVNKIVFFIFRIFPFGHGFGGVKLSEYYVYSQREKSFLIDKKGWKKDNVTINIKFIKAELYEQFLKKKHKQDFKTALFLLQGLNLVGYCSVEEEKHFINTMINYLSRNYEIVLIKDHPSCGNRLKNFNLPKNTTIIENMVEGFERSMTAYSFFSTSLIDAKVFGLKTIGINLKLFKVDEEVYENFDLKINFEDILANKI
jgi:hypothetical protein